MVRRLQEQKELNTRTNLVLGSDTGIHAIDLQVLGIRIAGAYSFKSSISHLRVGGGGGPAGARGARPRRLPPPGKQVHLPVNTPDHAKFNSLPSLFSRASIS